METIFQDTKGQMQKSIAGLKKELHTLRSGKVSASILDNIKVDYYGTPTQISQVANINILDANTISISPWEKNLLKDCQKVLQEANIGVSPNMDSDSIKLSFPPMSTEQRELIAKEAKGIGEKTKVSIKNIRKDGNDKIKTMLKNKDITEDENKKAQMQIQKITDEYIAQTDKIIKEKQEAIKTI